MSRLTVITATLGRSPHFREAVVSVEELHNHTVNHVVVCPPDAVQRIRAQAPGARIVTDLPRGLYAALNRGATANDGWEWITWINDDDRLISSGFSILVAAAYSHPEWDIAYGRVGLIDSVGKCLGFHPTNYYPEDLWALLAHGIVPFAQPGTLIGRRIFEQLSGLDESYNLAGDLDFFARAIGAGARYAFIDQEVSAFRLRVGQLSCQEALAREEKLRALARLQARSFLTTARAVLRFRWSNLGVYMDRIRRHGFLPMKGLYRGIES